MKKIALFDAKPYDRFYFDRAAGESYKLKYIESKLTAETAVLAKGCDAACAFVNDVIDAQAIDTLCALGIKILAMRCAGYSNVDIHSAYGRLTVVRVPAYSPYAVAEHAMALLLCLNRKLHKAYNRTRDFNFSLSGLTGVDLHGKTAGVIGTGKIGRAFIDICRGMGMNLLAYDPYPIQNADFMYVPLTDLLTRSDVISLHCPLTEQSYHILNREAFSKMKKGAMIINTSRGQLIDSQALLDALENETVRGAGLDVYEEEADFFFEDKSDTGVRDNTLALLVSRPNVILTSHQAFLTEEALTNIAQTTLENLDRFFSGDWLPNEVCYRCSDAKDKENCRKKQLERCF